ncbi:hypothetical protein GCM10007159_39230 [Modicisalibacter luteus]|nr:hypothetical protein GCM10007159_39230 [Halomonas lutea]
MDLQMSFAQRILGLSQFGFVLFTDILGTGLEAVFHTAPGFLDPTLVFGNCQVVLSSHFS